MQEDFESLLQHYAAQKKNHSLIQKAANDSRLGTDDLLQKGLSNIVSKRAGNDLDNFALLILHQRANEEVLTKSLALMNHEDPVHRQLGCDILREFPRLDDAPYPHSERVVQALEALIPQEEDFDVLLAALSCLGWQCHPAGLSLCLGMQYDERPSVRWVIVGNLLQMCPEGQKLPDAVVMAYLNFVRDSDQDIRWSVLWDFTEFPDRFKVPLKLFQDAAFRAQSDPEEKVATQAKLAFLALNRP